MTWQPAPVVYPDVELWSTGFIRAELGARAEPYAAGVYVSNAVPSTRHDRMVICRRDGGNVGELRDQARLSVRVWAAKEEDVNDLAALVIALFMGAADGDPVLRVAHQSGPTPIADASGQPLRYLVFDVHTRGVPL